MNVASTIHYYCTLLLQPPADNLRWLWPMIEMDFHTFIISFKRLFYGKGKFPLTIFVNQSSLQMKTSFVIFLVQYFTGTHPFPVSLLIRTRVINLMNANNGEFKSDSSVRPQCHPVFVYFQPIVFSGAVGKTHLVSPNHLSARWTGSMFFCVVHLCGAA